MHKAIKLGDKVWKNKLNDDNHNDTLLESSRLLPVCIMEKTKAHCKSENIIPRTSIFDFPTSPSLWGVYVCLQGATAPTPLLAVVVILFSLSVRAKALSCQSKMCIAAPGTFTLCCCCYYVRCIKSGECFIANSIKFWYQHLLLLF